MEFKVGDRVRWPARFTGIVHAIDPAHPNQPIVVECDFPFEGHQGNQALPTKNGWWCRPAELESLEPDLSYGEFEAAQDFYHALTKSRAG